MTHPMVNPRFQRNLGVLGPEQMAKLARTHVLIAGVGGAGGQCALDLARLGLGALTLADFDTYERRVPEGLTAGNVDAVLAGGEGLPPVDFVVEVIDIAGARAKEALHRACRQRGVPAMTGLMLGFGAALHVFQPDAPLYEELYVLPDGRIDLPAIIPHLGSYMLQEYMDACYQGRGHAPTCVVGATTAAGMMVSELVRGALLGPRAMVCWPEYLYVDLFDHRYVRGSVRPHIRALGR
jgi:hypothetical protein